MGGQRRCQQIKPKITPECSELKKCFFDFISADLIRSKIIKFRLLYALLKMPRFSCNHTAFVLYLLYLRTIAQCKFWEWHNRSAYAAKFFRRLHASEFVLRNRKKNCFQFIERNPARRQSNNIYLLRLIKSIFSRKTDIQQKYSIVPYKIKLPATLVCTLISEILF